MIFGVDLRFRLRRQHQAVIVGRERKRIRHARPQRNASNAARPSCTARPRTDTGTGAAHRARAPIRPAGDPARQRGQCVLQAQQWRQRAHFRCIAYAGHDPANTRSTSRPSSLDSGMRPPCHFGTMPSRAWPGGPARSFRAGGSAHSVRPANWKRSPGRNLPMSFPPPSPAPAAQELHRNAAIAGDRTDRQSMARRRPCDPRRCSGRPSSRTTRR